MKLKRIAKNRLKMAAAAYLCAAACLCMSGCARRESEESLYALTQTEESLYGQDQTETGAPKGAEAAPEKAADVRSDGEALESVEAEEDTVCVFVCGSVAFPGVYGLRQGDRVCDAVEAAGGFAGDADTEWLNLARTLTDGEQIRIYTRDETAAMAAEETAPEAEVPSDGKFAGESAQAEAGDGLVNLNLATKEELMQLPGIGEAKAESILAYREEHGGFSSPEEIMQISGIKTAVYERIRDKITVN